MSFQFRVLLSGSIYFNFGCVNWVYTSKVKNKHLAASDNGQNIVNLSNNKISIDVPATMENMSTFFKGSKLWYNGGNGTCNIITFIGVDFIDDMQLKCQIRLSDKSILLVDPETLNFIKNLDIASIPQTSEEYCRDCTNIKPSNLQHILNPKMLSLLQEEMMSHNYCLHHLHFPKLIVMAKNGEIPCRLATLKGRCPICLPCLFGMAHKRPWRSKSKQTHSIQKKSDNHPGARVSMDHLVSAQPGLIPQISGRFTSMRITGGTVIVDHYSDHVYVYLMQNLSLEETILAKHGYRQFFTAIDVTAKVYHADKGHFADKGFCDECTSSNQVITFCGVGSHHQNGIAEQKIKELTLVARTLLLHTKCMLPEYISTIMWPFALKCAEDRLNNLVHHADG
jgi:hypothetical protein